MTIVNWPDVGQITFCKPEIGEANSANWKHPAAIAAAAAVALALLSVYSRKPTSSLMRKAETFLQLLTSQLDEMSSVCN